MPCDYSKYPKNWKTEIRPAILKRAGHKCEWCGVANGERIWRDDDGKWHGTGNDQSLSSVNGHKVVKVVLTIAHVDNPDPMDCRPENLAALCQRCHLRHDRKHHAANAKATRDGKVGQGALL